MANIKAKEVPADAQETPPQKNIYSLMGELMRNIGHVGKDRQASQFKFRGIDDVMNELHPHMAKLGIFMTANTLNVVRDQTTASAKGNLGFLVNVDVEYTFHAPDGSSVSFSVRGEGMDYGDKATNKAYSAALKIVLLQAFLIPTQEPKDVENDESTTVKVLPEITPAHEKWSGLIAAISNGSYSLEKARTHFYISKTAELLIQQATQTPA